MSPFGAASCSSERSCRLHLHSCRMRHHRFYLCSFQMIALLIKHNLLAISALFCRLSHPLSLTLTHPHPFPVASCPGPVTKATSISFLKCQFALLSSRFTAITSPLSRSLSPLCLFLFCLSVLPHKYRQILIHTWDVFHEGNIFLQQILKAEYLV